MIYLQFFLFVHTKLKSDNPKKSVIIFYHVYN